MIAQSRLIGASVVSFLASVKRGMVNLYPQHKTKEVMGT
jgi:hypothetical protein